MDSKWFFDKADRDLLRMVNDAVDRKDGTNDKVFDVNLHPHGILELATTHEFRVARAVINLFGRLEAGQVADRLLALQSLRDEVLHSAQTPFRYNTGRVLVQIMKEIVRARNDEETQLRYMHDFRKAASGNPRIVRTFLARHLLLEMPEEWNQLTMDHHVHDANTKGRKNPTHLILDAWLKGIRFLNVIYYNFVEPSVARELLRAAEIMGVEVRMGIEFRSVFRGKFVDFVWVPRGFTDVEAFFAFLDEKPARELMAEGRKATRWVEECVFNTLDRWNAEHRLALMSELDMELPPISRESFFEYVHTGQASVLHLAEIIHRTCLPRFHERAEELKREALEASPERQQEIDTLLHRMDAVLPESILDVWLTPERNPELAWLAEPCEASGMPEIMRLPPPVLLDWLAGLRSGYSITLQLASLTPEDVLELLWDCQGHITHLELFNLKEWQEGYLPHLESINDLQRSINNGSVLHLKRILHGMMERLEASEREEDRLRLEKFRTIRRSITALQAPYRYAPLRSRIGTDSTSNTKIRHGMGLAILETLPRRTQRALFGKKGYRPLVLPLHADLIRRKIWTEPERLSPLVSWIYRIVRRIPGFGFLGLLSSTEWELRRVVIQKGKSNIVTMGGANRILNNGLRVSRVEETGLSRKFPGLAYLNTHVADALKVLAGFVPAQLAFFLTQDWWFLVWFGAAIWYLITGLRNIQQAVYGGGGRFWKTSVLRWNNYVNWSRLCDSLLYTGFSVLLLEWGVRVMLLQNLFSYTVVNDPLLVFTVIAVANGSYLAWHNAYRGLPRSAIIGNLFRSIGAIPLSILYFNLLCALAELWGVASPALFLQPGAAIISKAASDTVAGAIEGLADRNNNKRLRSWDYSTKFGHMLEGYVRLELRFPDRNIMDLLEKPGALADFLAAEARDMFQTSIVNALDLMYFWLYQPYAQQTLRSLVRTMTPEECLLLTRTQWVLLRTRDVSQLFVDGLVGTRFARALSFYLDHYEGYVNDINQLCTRSRKQTDEIMPMTASAELSRRAFRDWSQN